jgi:hypothetical protein
MHPISAYSTRRRLGVALLLLAPLTPAGGLLVDSGSAGAATPTTIDLGTAAAASVLAGSTVTNTGPSVLPQDLDVSPGSAITGFPPGSVTPPGVEHAGDAVAADAQSDLTTAYNAAAAAPSTTDETGVDLGSGQTLTEGVFTASSGMQLTGQLTLSGDANAVFIFQAGSTLTTASDSSILLVGGAQACNVFWQVGSSATVGTDTTFVGNILALTSITLTAGATVDGRALASNGAVTLDDNVFTTPGCATGSGGPTTTSSISSTTIATTATTAGSTGATTTLAPVPLPAGGVSTSTPTSSTPTTSTPTTTSPTSTPTTTSPTTSLATTASPTTVAATPSTTVSSTGAVTASPTATLPAAATSPLTPSLTSATGAGSTGSLAFTGIHIAYLLELASVLLLAGGLLLVSAGYRRRPSD